ncbi:NUDIX hydrolase [Gulosibacter molinativorax]|uniref:NUDIX hydrolase n=1 Tax=Gulosibacter molinativorax TaxID=256821 RepID=A0ABT7C4C3_9MICO|nr:NUDIX domain-containing protein [Gulosibacter molinativorax]MDJ1370069.1 NUDIX hydrolase [Gulosibacter molinativorax]QUY63738.1 8-oxo-dGTP diphosphatase [Gulosibacter molinativorax]
MTQSSVALGNDNGNGNVIRLAVSTVIFALRPAKHPSKKWDIVMPVVLRTRDPHEGKWALPGGWLREDEGLAAAASRTLAETTGLHPAYLEQLYAFGAVDRSPTRVVSVLYWALLRADAVQQRATPENVEWFSVDGLWGLAFDHDEIVQYALWRLQNKLDYSGIAQGFLPELFTLSDLREVHEAVLNKPLDPANFRRQVEGSGEIVPTDQFRKGSHRPARLYRTNSEVALASHGPLKPDTQ